MVDAIPSQASGQGNSLSLEMGEKLCFAFEALQACYPQTDLEFEHLLLLVTGLAEGSCLRLGECRGCGASILVDTLSVRDSVCLAGCGGD